MSIDLKAYVLSSVAAYRSLRGDVSVLDGFELFLEANTDLSSRHNLSGHLTGSAVVLDTKSNSILRVHHAKIDKWVFSAGGHMDAGEMPWETSRRELLEELGVTAKPMFSLNSPVPFILDVQPIPASLVKREPAHWHYDMIYLYSVTERPKIVADPSEVKNFAWIDIGDVLPSNSPVNFASHLQAYRS